MVTGWTGFNSTTLEMNSSAYLLEICGHPPDYGRISYWRYAPTQSSGVDYSSREYTSGLSARFNS